MENTKKLIDFISKSPDAYHAVRSAADILDKHGFTRLYETEEWKIREGCFYVTRNDSSVIAFKIPKTVKNGFHICASHTDSPCFKLKPDFEGVSESGIKLRAEGYGGMLMPTWLDRPLGVSGRLITVNNGAVKSHLVNIDRDIALIPSLAIHLNREANKGYEYNVKRDMYPLAGGESGEVLSLAAQSAGVEAEDIKGFDLYLYNRERGSIFGAAEEYFCAPRIDDLQCMFSSLEGFIQAENTDKTAVFAAFDNEEVGSGTKQGALSTFLRDTLMRINYALGGTDEDYRTSLAKSFMLSCDNAHALHPNHADKYDEENRVYMNKGVVIKYNANQKYTTDAVSEAAVKYVCEKAEVPYQLYTNRSDMPGGSTLGNLSGEKVSVPTADIGLAQLAMHSCMETAGVLDTTYMIRMTREFYGCNIEL